MIIQVEAELMDMQDTRPGGESPQSVSGQLALDPSLTEQRSPNMGQGVGRRQKAIWPHEQRVKQVYGG